MYSPEEVNQLYIKAETAIKGSEADGALSVVAVNELRYAGRHLSRYITLDDHEEKQKELEKAANHCLRAIKDAIDIQVLTTKESEARYYRLVHLKNFAAITAGTISLIAAIIAILAR